MDMRLVNSHPSPKNNFKTLKKITQKYHINNIIQKEKC